MIGKAEYCLIFDNVLTHIVNPNNESADDETGFYPQDVDDRFMMTWRILIACWFVLAIVGIATTFPGPIPKSETKKRNNIQGIVNISNDSV